MPHWGNEKFKKKYQELFSNAYDKAVTGITIADNEYLVYSSEEFKLVRV
jgi:hypothetical protein